jgi:hypothetical protein
MGQGVERCGASPAHGSATVTLSARQAEAERDRRAKSRAATSSMRAQILGATALGDAAPLRQDAMDIAGACSSTILLPLPTGIMARSPRLPARNMRGCTAMPEQGDVLCQPAVPTDTADLRCTATLPSLRLIARSDGEARGAAGRPSATSMGNIAPGQGSGADAGRNPGWCLSNRSKTNHSSFMCTEP